MAGVNLIMPKDDLYVSEKRWRRKRLFRKRAQFPAPRITILVIILAALTALAWWLEWLPVAQATGMMPR